ncbi:MAG: response regulator [Candidatus Eremiobacterota bacterium]
MDTDRLRMRAQALLREQRLLCFRRTDRLLAWLLLCEWAASVAVAVVVTPRTWIGQETDPRVHLWLALGLGALCCFSSGYLVLTRPGATFNRFWVASAQMLMSCLMIHLTGGRLETHFMVFGSLAFLSYYRDERVFLPATLTVVVDHLFRGLYLPLSVYGVAVASPWRTVEHAGWVVFEVFFLVVMCRQSVREMNQLATNQAQLESVNETVEATVELRTRELQESQRQLAAQAEELREARDRALESARAKSRFLANMSHEIRTPMNGVIGMAELLSTMQLTAEQSEFVHCIRTCADSLLTIINDILDFSKIEAGKLQIEGVDFEPRAAMEDLAEMFAHLAHSKGLELICRVDADVPASLHGDSGRIHQIAANFLSNAIKFTHDGHVILRVEALSYSGQEAWLRFSVEDSGIGVSPDKLQAILEPFEQADGDVGRRYGGTGLGLSISKQLAEMMGGQLGVCSKPQEGSMFWVDLPLRLAPHSCPSPPPDRLRGLNILVVDDHPVNRRVFCEQLALWGCRATEATSGAEALELLGTAERFDLILLDMMMPEMDGRETAQILRGNPAWTRIPLVLLTSMGVDRDRFLDMGFQKVLTKPVRQGQLRTTLLECLGAAEARQTASNGKRASNLEGLRVLVAEDNPVNQKVVTRMLERAGCRIHTVGNGKEALHSYSQFSFDVVLMDVQMPEMDGLQATEAIRRVEVERGFRTPIIALTANAMEGDRERILAAGLDDYLPKPIRSDALVDKLLEVASARRALATAS